MWGRWRCHGHRNSAPDAESARPWTSRSQGGGPWLLAPLGLLLRAPWSLAGRVNNFGPWQYPEKLRPLFVTNLLEGHNVPLYGDGRKQRDCMFVEDNCAAVDLVLRRGQPGQVYNIGAGNELPNRADRQAAGPGRGGAGTGRLRRRPPGP